AARSSSRPRAPGRTRRRRRRRGGVPAARRNVASATAGTRWFRPYPTVYHGRLPETLVAMRITSTSSDPALLELPLQIPLSRWPSDRLVALPRGLSRHVVRFVRVDGAVYAVKETPERIAQREYDLLRGLERLDAPSVEAVAIVADRADDAGEPLESVLIT